MADARIRIIVDGEEANLTLGEIDSKLESLNDQAGRLDDTTEEFARLTEQINMLQKAASDLKLSVDADTTAAQESIDALASSLEGIQDRSISVDADVSPAIEAIDSVGNGEPVSVVVEADTSEAQAGIASLAGEPISVPVDVDLSGAQGGLDSIAADPVTLEVQADVEPAVENIASLSNVDPVEVPVSADVNDAQAQIDALSAEPITVPVELETPELGDIQVDPIVVPVDVDLGAAQEGLDSLTGEPITVDVQADVDPAVENIASLTNVDAVEVPVSADVTEAQSAVDGIVVEPVVVDVAADVSGAQQEVDSLSAEELTVEVHADVEPAVENIASLSSVDPIEVPVSADVTEAQAQIESVGAEPVVVPVEADVEQAQQEIDSLTVDPVEVEITADPSQLQGELVGLQVDEVVVPVAADTTAAQADIDALAGEVVVTVRADVSPAQGDIDSVGAEPVVVPVSADVTQAVEEVATIVPELVVVPVIADASDAQAEVDSVQPETVVVPVEADTAPASDAIAELTQGAVVEVTAEADVSGALDAVEEVRTATEQPFVLVVDATTSTESIAELRTQLKAAKDEIASSDVGSDAFIAATQRAGELKDKIQDIGEAIDAQKGEPIERLGSQFRGLGDSIVNLDFKKATDQFKTFSQTLGQVDLKSLTQGAGGFAKAIGGGVVDAFKTLGRIIIANPILLIATIILGVGAALFKLKDSIKPVQIAFDAIGDAIGFVIDLFKSFSDALGLSSFAETEAIEKANKAYEEKTKAIEENSKRAIAALKAEGATQEEIAQVTADAARQSVEANKEVVAAEAARLASLQGRVDAGRELADDDKEFFDKAIEHLGKEKDAVIALTQAELDLKKVRQDAANAELQAQDQLAVLEATNGRERVAAQKKAIDDTAAIQKQAAITAGKSQAEVDLILRKAQADKLALDDAYGKAAAAKAKARLDAINALENEFTATDRERSAKSFDDKLKQLAAQGIKEGELVDAINARKQAALDKIDADSRKADEDRAARAIALQNQLAVLQEEAATRASVAGAPDAEAAAQAQIEGDKRVSELRVQALEAQKKDALRVLEETTAAQLTAADLTEAQRTDILAEGELARQKIVLESDAAIEAERKKSDEERKAELIKELEDETKAIEDARSKLANNANAGLGLLGLTANLDALQDGLAAEQKLLDDAYAQGALSKEEHEKRLTDLQKSGEETRAELSAAAVESTLQQAQQVVSIIGDFANSQIEADQARVEAERTELQTQYDQRKAFIEANVQDEAKRARALAQLDKDFAGDTAKLDRQALELKKKAIKTDRNVAVAQIILSTAIGIAGALKTASSTGNPVAFAITLAAGLAAVVATISKANAALKQADASLGAIGAAGGGDAPTPSIGAGAQAPASGSPSPTFNPQGVNNAQNVDALSNSGQPVINATVSVIDINNAQRRVSVAETTSSIGG